MRRLALWTTLLLMACGPSSIDDTAKDFDQEFLVVPKIWLHLESSLTNEEKGWAEEAIRAHDGHYWTWRARLGTHKITRIIDVYVHNEANLVSPRRAGVLSFLVESDTAPRDEIHVVLGEKGTLPGFMQELHQASLWPRDFYHQDPLAGWELIFGSPVQPQAGTGLVAGPAPVVNVVTSQTTWNKGLQQIVVERLESQR